MESLNYIQIRDIPLPVINDLVENLYRLKILDFKQLNGYDDKNYWLKKVDYAKNDISDNNRNEHWPHGYVLKITNEKDSMVDGLLEAQTMLLLHLNKKGLRCPEPVTTVDGKIMCLKRLLYSIEDKDSSGGLHAVRLLKFVPGKIICTTEYTTSKLEQVGELLARFHILSSDFCHSAYENHQPSWSLAKVVELKQLVQIFDEVDKRQLLEAVINTFENRALKILHTLTQGLLHGDFNEQNILVDDDDESETERVVSFLDLGDSHYGPYVFDVALAILYMMLDAKSDNVNKVGGHVLKGYLKHRILSREEMALLKLAICARLCQSLILGMFTYKNNPVPENSYVLTTQTKGWPLLQTFWLMDENELYNVWNSILIID